MELSSKK